MRNLILAAAACCAAFAAGSAWAANDKIDPKTFICAELVATSVDMEPPIFEGLQLDGYAAGLANKNIADPAAIQPLLLKVYDACSASPVDKALPYWQKMRENEPYAENGKWDASKITCGDYTANEDEGSGFVIWLDAWQRARTGKDASVFKDQATLDNFLDICRKNPQKLMYDVMVENAK